MGNETICCDGNSSIAERLLFDERFCRVKKLVTLSFSSNHKHLGDTKHVNYSSKFLTGIFSSVSIDVLLGEIVIMCL